MLARDATADTDRLARAVAKLPRLPSTVRYLDDFSDEWRALQFTSEDDRWAITAGGQTYALDFSLIEQIELRELCKHWIVWTLQRLAPATTHLYFSNVCKLVRKTRFNHVVQCCLLSPFDADEFWHRRLIPLYSTMELSSLKSLLSFLCAISFNQFTPRHTNLIGHFRLPCQDSYAAVRSGAVFLTAKEEATIIDYLDQLNARLAREGVNNTGVDELRSACVLCISFQCAMRPNQTAKVRLSDVRVYDPEKNESPTVHITFLRGKQRSSGKRLPMTRKVKREWSWMFIELFWARRADVSANLQIGALPDSYFGLSPKGITRTISAITYRLTGRRCSANHLRHTAAQRLVDAGATKEELAEFMGHASTKTGLVYFDVSPTQADRVNKALAISPIFNTVARIAKTRTIDKTVLLNLDSDRQIGGVPHGIPIAGIGACNLGQSLCTKNPVLACYTCSKFMASNDPATHREVVNSLRPVVNFFHDASRGDTQSPAYMQLRHTFAEAERISLELATHGGDYE